MEALHQSPVVIWEGRSPRDVDVDDTDGQVRPLVEILRARLREELGLVLLTYSRATGLVWDTPDLQAHNVREPVRRALSAFHLLDPAGEAFVAEDPARFFRAAYELLRVPSAVPWPDGRPLRFAILVEFADHVLPHEASSMSDEEMRAAEWVSLLASSLAMRRHAHRLILYTPDAGLVNPLVRASIPVVRVPYPDRTAKARFIEALRRRLYPNARTEEGLDWDLVARLSANTPNISLVDLMSRREPISRAQLVTRRSRDVAAISEGLLTPMEETPEELFGRSIRRAQALLARIAERLRRADPDTPHNLLLAGPPGSGKTALVQWLARQSGVPAYRVHSPKHSLVGETERRSRLLFELLLEWAPSIGFIDEITEAFPTERPELDLDAGASRAVVAAMLAYLGDERRRGRTLLVAATNCPWRMGAALRSRFVVIPVLSPPADDYPAIVAGLARRILGLAVSPDDPAVQEAAQTFYARAASPRHIIKAMANVRIAADGGPDLIRRAARTFCGDTAPEAVALADLWAVHLTDCLEFLPWYGDPEYPLPPHLQGVVRPDGSIDRRELQRRIEELSGRVRM
jgi:hypothetical protein